MSSYERFCSIALGHGAVAFLPGTSQQEIDKYFREQNLRLGLNRKLCGQASSNAITDSPIINSPSSVQAPGGNVVIGRYIPMPVYEDDMHIGETLLDSWKPSAPDWWVIQNRERTTFHPQTESDSFFQQWMLHVGRIIDWTVSLLFGKR